ncbi:MAG TPA: hypothetical protein V6D23_20510, partial [Candidatus Obscuribacterales bacterium]
ETVQTQDPDQLYDQLEKALFHWIRELMKQPPPQAGIKPEVIEQLQKQNEELEDRVRGFDRQITLLDQDFDTSELRRRLRPLEVMLQRYQKALEVSESMQMIHKQLQGLIDTVRGISARVQNPVPEQLQRAEAEIESLMDSCDWVADQLDALDNQGHDIGPLEYSYKILAAIIEQVRDTVDEHTV